MSLDLENSLQDIKSRIDSLKVASQSLSEINEAKKKVKDNLEKQESKVIDAIDKVKEEKKRLKRQLSGQIGNLLSIFSMSSGNGPESTNYVKKRFVQILNRCRPVMQRLTRETMINCVGCSQEQTYVAGKIYIPISSIDQSNMLKNFRPDVEEGSTLYESTPPVDGQFPFSMNRELWNRIQNIDNDITFNGKSGQGLFRMKYVTENDFGENGDFLEIQLLNRVGNLNNVTTFLNDYYSSINIIDIEAIYTQMIEILFGGLSISASIGYSEVSANKQVQLIIQRILGLCFDQKNEIDVSGVSKISELDSIDDSFFELTNVDLRTIEQETNNIINGVIEFEECDNVKLPIDTKPLFKILSQIKQNQGKTEQLDKLGSELTNSIINNPDWKLRLPSSFNLELKIDTDFIEKMPIAIVMSLLSPKVLLPVFIMFKALGNPISDLIRSFLDFFKKFSKCMVKLVSKIGAVFVRELFLMIKRDLLKIVNSIAREINKEKIAKKYILIAKLVAILALIVKAVIDWRKCKSVLDEILLILNIIMLGKGRDDGISPLLLSFAGFLPGYSSTRAFANIIEEFQKQGLPTGPMPDGSPNLMLASIKAQLDGNQREKLNSRGSALIPPLAVTPVGTLPMKINLLPDV